MVSSCPSQRAPTTATLSTRAGSRPPTVGSKIRQIPGVTDVAVDLTSGTVTVTTDQPVEDAAVAAAVDEAGYALAR
jgi:copper chaperone